MKNLIKSIFILAIIGSAVLSLTACKGFQIILPWDAPDGECEHVAVVDPAIEATCERMGRTEGSHCSKCGEILVEQAFTPFKSHTYDDKYDSTCNICGYVRDALCAHESTETMTGIAATCTTTGLTEGKKCSDCYAILIAQTIIPEKPHTESDWIIDIAATTELEGEKHTECTVCGATVRTVAIPCSSSEGLLFRLNSDRKSYTVVGIGTCTDTKLIIPSEYNGLPVTAIGNDFVKGNASIVSINIPDSITNIGSNAFDGCTSLSSVTIPDSVTSIGDNAFWDCTSLETVYWNATACTYAGSYSYPIFENCTSLKTVVIGDDVTTIPAYAFYGCTSLKYNEYDNAYYLGNSTNPYVLLVKAKSTDITSCDINSNTKFIHNSAFEGCTSLTSVTIPDRATLPSLHPQNNYCTL